jgi:CDP-diacylglycerol pyrophosphatase
MFWNVMTQKLLKQDNIAPMLKLLLPKVYGHHKLVEHYEIAISQMAMDIFYLLTRLLPDFTMNN